MVTVRIATADDRNNILEMWKSLTLNLPQHHFKPFGDPVLPERIGMLTDMLDNALSSSTAAVFKIHNQCCCGTIAAVLNQQTGFSLHNSGVLFNLWIEPEFRRRGYATALVKHAKTWLQQQGAESVQVGWHPDNNAADQFWKQQGFKGYEIIGVSPIA